MPQQPTGTVTLLFSDLEGSTRLVEGLGPEKYRESLAVHHELLRNVFGRHGGYEVDNEGDSFFVAFSRAADAVAAASEAQHALASIDWPDGLDFRVRMGIHTGEPLVAPPKYIGLDVHKAARIMAAGHGGQVLLSAETRALVSDDTSLPLGEHQLKDFSRPEPIYQLRVDGLPAEFPPLKTLYVTNLPPQATPFIGRERDVDAIVRLLQDTEGSVLTLLGPGGVGKTRLALEAAATAKRVFKDGVTWVGLAPVREGRFVVEAIAHAVGIQDQLGPEPLRSLTEALTGSRRLVVLDNAEHLPADVARCATALRRARTVTVLVTSRERLQIAGEQTWVVPLLSDEDAETLFMACARRVAPAFVPDSRILDLCRRLDRLPLAIELAAARSAVFTPAQLLERIGRRLDALSGPRDADPRHRTLRATIDWSYDLLDETERSALRALSVFPSDFALDAVERVAAAPDCLEALLEKSLVFRQELEPEPRYAMLEVVREYASDKLREAGGLPAARARLVEWAADFAASAEADAWTPNASLSYRRVNLELDNLREAMTVALASGEADTALQIAAGLAPMWQRSSRYSEGRSWVQRAIAAKKSPRAPVLGQVAFCLGVMAAELGDGDEAKRRLEESLPLLDQHNRPAAIYARYVLFDLTYGSDRVEAAELAQEAVDAAEVLESPLIASLALEMQARLIAHEDPAAARDLAARTAELARTADVNWHAGSLQTLAEYTAATGDLASARGLLEEAAKLGEVADDDWRRRATLGMLALLDVIERDLNAAEERLGDLELLTEEDEGQLELSLVALVRAAIAASGGDPESARSAWAEAQALRQMNGRTWDLVEARVIRELLDPA